MRKLVLVLCAAMMCAANVFAQASDNKDVNCGGGVTITATHATGYHFVKWQKGGADFAGNTANPLIVSNIKGDSAYVAFFAANDYNFGDGVTISPTPTPEVGAVITLTAAPTDDCLEFDKWSDDVTTNPRTITYDGTAPFQAVYKTKVYNVTANTETGDATQGTVSISVTVVP